MPSSRQDIYLLQSTVLHKMIDLNKKSYIYEKQVKHICNRQVNHQNQFRYETDIEIIMQGIKNSFYFYV